MSRRSSDTESTAESRAAESAATDSPADLALVEYMRRIDRGERVDRRAFIAAHPEAAAELTEYFAATVEFDQFVGGINLGFGPELVPSEPLRPPVPMGPAALEEDSQDLSHYQGVILVEGIDPEAPEAESVSAEDGIEEPPVEGGDWKAPVAILGGVALGAAALVTGIFWLPGLLTSGERYQRVAPNTRPFVTEETVWVTPGALLEVYTEQKADFAPFQPPKGLSISQFEPFAGKRSIVIDRLVQSDMLSGFPVRIKEKPLGGEYRYLRFAWRKETSGPIAFVLWGPRRYIYYAGGHRITPADVALDLGESPTVWKTVERDIFEDFGPIQLRGIGLFTLTGEPANFDQISLSANRESFTPWDGSPAPAKKAAAEGDETAAEEAKNPALPEKVDRKGRVRRQREQPAAAP